MAELSSLVTAVREQVRLFLTATQYFTRVPVPAWIGHDAGQLDGSARYFPLVGLCVGGVAAAVLLACDLLFPAWMAVVLSCACTMMLTGAFHEDGLADTVDGLGATADRDRALSIMKDSRIGTFGALALFMTVLTKIAALAAFPIPLAALALVAGHALSRWCAIVVMARLRYVRDDDSSRAKPLVRHISTVGLCVATACGVAPVALLGGIGAFGALAAGLVLVTLSRWFSRRLGGYTGDTLGATQQLTEVAFYLGTLGAWKYS